MATIGDVARRAGVSTTLVSRYLNGVKGVSPASKEKIENAIRELNYVPDESARMLVRRRGGGTSASLPAGGTVALPASVALICEDVDAQLVSSVYLGAKHALWASEAHHDVHILLFCIPDDENRAADEDATLSYIKAVCRGVLCVGASAQIVEKLEAASQPTVLLSPREDAKTLYRTAPDFRSVCTALEGDSAHAVITLCERIKDGSMSSVRAEASIAHTFTVSDEPYKEYNPVGRRLQSHLL